MVNKVWFRELLRRWFKAKAEAPNARCFSEPRCQDSLETWYLFYRWLICLLWLSIVVCSILELGSVQPLGYWEKWPIYLTNWDLALGLIQSVLGAVLVSRRWNLQKKPGFDADNLAYGKLEKTYWVLYVTTTSLALGVTGTYWGLVHDSKVHHVDVLNVLIHVGNSALMLMDFCVTRVPFKLRCFWWSTCFTSLYLLFTVVYYLAGGLDKRGKPRIYDVLNWARPARTLVYCAGGLVFLVVVHCLLYFIARFRDRSRKAAAAIQVTGAEKADAPKCDSYV